MVSKPTLVTFDIKIENNKFLKLLLSMSEDRKIAVKNFCKTYRISKDREGIIMEEVNKYFVNQVCSNKE